MNASDHRISFLNPAWCMAKGKVPGQLVIQLTDRCNAGCPQCGMRKTNPFPRVRLPNDRLRAIIDAAGQKGFQAISFTGGEPLLLEADLPGLITRAGQAGIPCIRTGTNGFFFTPRPGFEDRVKRIADALAATPLRNFWISLDSALPRIHEAMRGFEDQVRGIETALPIFHDRGLYPSVNLGLNRNLTRETAVLPAPGPTDLENPKNAPFYQTFVRAFHAFYQKAVDLGFTIANACYPMSMADDGGKQALSAVYAAASPDRVVCFTRTEKALMFMALMDTIPAFRSRIRIFSPRSALSTLSRDYADPGRPPRAFPCRGGIDFFFVNCRDGHTYPCGYRGHDNLGPLEDLNLAARPRTAGCLACDWECFRDPSELAGPFLSLWDRPLTLLGRLFRDPGWFALWKKDLAYYRACDWFDGRKALDSKRLDRF